MKLKLPEVSDFYTNKDVRVICAEHRVKHLYMALIMQYGKVAPDDLQAARDAVTFSLDWKAGKMFSFDETAKQCSTVLTLFKRYNVAF